jgi:hypothetical protein
MLPIDKRRVGEALQQRQARKWSIVTRERAALRSHQIVSRMLYTEVAVVDMPLAVRSVLPAGMITPRTLSRLASTSTKPLPKYTGRIPKPAPPPPGPGETKTPDSPEETQQARRAIMDSIQEDKNKDYQRRYRGALWKWTGIICGTPIVLVLGPYLFKRSTHNLKHCSNTTFLTLLYSLSGRRPEKARYRQP